MRYARTIVVLKFHEVEVLVRGLLLLTPGGGGGGLSGGLGLLGGGGLGLGLADDDGHGGLPGLAVRELEQAEIEASHRGRRRSSRRDLDRRLRVARLAALAN